ncbi:hypothetical protein D2M30_3699 [Bacillus amyloliquefaciens]|nr:hypothetical protein D2M30_3699 [Bacillus amyloliquefaciens]
MDGADARLHQTVCSSLDLLQAAGLLPAFFAYTLILPEAAG